MASFTTCPDYQELSFSKTRTKRPEVICKKRCSLKFRKIHRKTPVPETLF